MTQSAEIAYALAASPQYDKDAMCFAALSSGLYRSNDGGSTWQLTNQSLAPHSAMHSTAVAVSPEFAHDNLVISGFNGGIARSTDAGTSWDIVSFSSPPPLVSAIVFSPTFAEDNTVIAATLDDGVFRSNDAGESWDPSNAGLLDRHVLSLAVDLAEDAISRIFAGTQCGVWESTNGGRSWRETLFQDDCEPILSLAAAVDSQNRRAIYIGTEMGINRAILDDARWIIVDRTHANAPINAISTYSDNDLTQVIAITDSAVWLSLNDGQTWLCRKAESSSDLVLTTFIAPLSIQPDAPIIFGTSSNTSVPLITTHFSQLREQSENSS